MAGANLRDLALDIWLAVVIDGERLDRYLGAVLSKYQYLEKKERAFLTRLSLGCVENAILLDAIIDDASSTKTKKMKPIIRGILELSAYQMHFMDGVPEPAIVNEAVKLAKNRGLSGLSGFVNGVLRGMLRKKQPIENFGFGMATRYSMPEWIAQEWISCYGEATTKSILSSFLQMEKTAIRTNLSKITPEDLKTRLKAEGMKVEPSKRLPYAFYIFGYDYLEKSECFRQGLFFVSDISSMLVGERAAVQQGERVLDVCAAPGGKSMHIAETGAAVEARDVSEAKVKKIEENIRRMGMDNVTARVWDATVPDENSMGAFDVVVADLPCSGLGVLGKKPEIKYRITPAQIKELADLQSRILDTVCAYVKPKGRLIFSTCTISRRENQENTARFLTAHPMFTLVSEEQILPYDGLWDGFYIAVMKHC